MNRGALLSMIVATLALAGCLDQIPTDDPVLFPAAAPSSSALLHAEVGSSNITRLGDCKNSVILLYSSAKYAEAKSAAFACREGIAAYKSLLAQWRQDYPGVEQKTYLDNLTVWVMSADASMQFYYNRAILAEMELDKRPTMLESLAIQTRATSGYIETARYAYQSGLRLPNSFRDVFQAINLLYDSAADPAYKYAAQVNPNDPLMGQIVDAEIGGTKTDKDAMKRILRDYVRGAVTYRYDPSWQSDWPQPPAITLAIGEGDCDDFSILLVSLYRRAGIPAELCFVDTNQDGNVDHMTVLADNVVWEPQAFDNIASWELTECFEPDRYIAEHPLQNPCNDNTHSGRCSTANVGWQCSNGELASRCDVCGCATGQYCYNKKCVTCNYGYYLGIDGLCHQSR